MENCPPVPSTFRLRFVILPLHLMLGLARTGRRESPLYETVSQPIERGTCSAAPEAVLRRVVGGEIEMFRIAFSGYAGPKVPRVSPGPVVATKTRRAHEPITGHCFSSW